MVDRMWEICEARRREMMGDVKHSLPEVELGEEGRGRMDIVEADPLVGNMLKRYSWLCMEQSSTGLAFERQLSVQSIVASTVELTRQVRELTNVHFKPATATSDVNRLLSEAQKLHSAAFARLQLLAVENAQHYSDYPDEDDVVVQLRENIHSMFARPLKMAVTNFHTAIEVYRDLIEQDNRRHLHQAGVTDEKKVDQIIASGQTEQVIQTSISGEVSEAILAVEQRHTAIQQLERDVLALNQLFQDFASMIETQQEHIDAIQTHVDNARRHVKRADVKLEQGQQHHKAARKSQCCILIVVILALTALLTPTILQALSASSSS
jgi:hypothetical protein